MYRDRLIYVTLPLMTGMLVNLGLDYGVCFVFRGLGVWLIYHTYIRWLLVSTLALIMSYPLYIAYIRAVYGYRNLSAIFGLAMAMVWALRNGNSYARAMHMPLPTYLALVWMIGGGLLALSLAGTARGFGLWPRRSG